MNRYLASVRNFNSSLIDDEQINLILCTESGNRAAVTQTHRHTHTHIDTQTHTHTHTHTYVNAAFPKLFSSGYHFYWSECSTDHPTLVPFESKLFEILNYSV
jgi:hypothetical protein